MSTLMAPPRKSPAGERSRHRAVLVREVIRWLDLRPGLTVVDGTVGAGGHSSAILPLIQPGGWLIGLDRDPMMLGHASRVLEGQPAELVQSSYADLDRVLERLGLSSVDRVLLDLGLSSDQLADRERGFSFDADGPLDLRFDVSQGKPAAELIATLPAEELARIFTDYGEEPHARKFAELLVAARLRRPIATARELAEVLTGSGSPPARRGGSHPATRVFQALRIAANRELEELDRMLHATLPAALARGGRAVIISFHSLEDRMVKEAFRDKTRWQELTAKPVRATPSEERINPRSRTASLRAAVRV